MRRAEFLKDKLERAVADAPRPRGLANQVASDRFCDGVGDRFDIVNLKIDACMKLAEAAFHGIQEMRGDVSKSAFYSRMVVIVLIGFLVCTSLFNGILLSNVASTLKETTAVLSLVGEQMRQTQERLNLFPEYRGGTK